MYFINKCYWYKWIEMDNMYIVNVIYFILNERGGGGCWGKNVWVNLRFKIYIICF